jgi:hypothetical protein
MPSQLPASYLGTNSPCAAAARYPHATRLVITAAGTPARYINDPAVVDTEAGLAQRDFEFVRTHLRFLAESHGGDKCGEGTPKVEINRTLTNLVHAFYTKSGTAHNLSAGD